MFTPGLPLRHCPDFQRLASRIWSLPVRLVYLTCLLVTWSASVAQAQAKDSSLPIPDEAAQTKSKETVRQIYKDQFTKSVKNEQKLDLATNMLTDALATVDAPADRYTLLRIARDMASQIGSVEI